ncbi:Thoeris anti-defense Tad2 family protein [Staphylococcus nepalensis]|uniref:Thoeris anti-defense Tad2 family protein n=1 Tax=Staphylococcus nepalensis TaxID=214473 RepID=UPI003CF3B2C0
MNIQEATKLAMEKGKPIYREEWEADDFSVAVRLLPTNEFGYITVSNQNKDFIPLWQPMAEDLLANDWSIYSHKTRKFLKNLFI